MGEAKIRNAFGHRKDKGALEVFSRMGRKKKYQEKRRRRTKRAIIEKVKDLRTGLKSDLPWKETRDLEYGEFYGF